MKLRIICTMIMLASACSSETTEKNGSKNRVVASETQASELTQEQMDAEQKKSVVEDSNEGVTVPVQVTGVYLTGDRLPEDQSGVIKVGIIGMLNKDRISDKPDQYETAWAVVLDKNIGVPYKLAKSKDPKYDQIFEFFGSERQFKEQARHIQIYLQFFENVDGALQNNTIQEPLPTILNR